MKACGNCFFCRNVGKLRCAEGGSHHGGHTSAEAVNKACKAYGVKT